MISFTICPNKLLITTEFKTRKKKKSKASWRTRWTNLDLMEIVTRWVKRTNLSN